MKEIFLYSALISFTIFTTCNKQELEDDFIPANQESSYVPKSDKADNQDINTLNRAKADFTINNVNNEVDEKDVLLLTNNSVNAVSYHWDFGNGDTSIKAYPNYKYEKHGYYTITLTITDARGNTHKASHEILVLCIFGGGEHDQ
ncbi:MAG: PKD domain-containing protein [Saprospiraceae bacterium]|nr:PKD domain-containing protein [Saprospiraceae bacterium]